MLCSSHWYVEKRRTQTRPLTFQNEASAKSNCRFRFFFGMCFPHAVTRSVPASLPGTIGKFSVTPPGYTETVLKHGNEKKNAIATSLFNGKVNWRLRNFGGAGGLHAPACLLGGFMQNFLQIKGKSLLRPLHSVVKIVSGSTASPWTATSTQLRNVYKLRLR